MGLEAEFERPARYLDELGATGVGPESGTDMALGQAWSLGPQRVILGLELVDASLVPSARGTGLELGLEVGCPSAGLESMSARIA